MNHGEYCSYPSSRGIGARGEGFAQRECHVKGSDEEEDEPTRKRLLLVAFGPPFILKVRVKHSRGDI